MTFWTQFQNLKFKSQTVSFPMTFFPHKKLQKTSRNFFLLQSSKVRCAWHLPLCILDQLQNWKDASYIVHYLLCVWSVSQNSCALNPPLSMQGGSAAVAQARNPFCVTNSSFTRVFMRVATSENKPASKNEPAQIRSMLHWVSCVWNSKMAAKVFCRHFYERFFLF